MKKVALVCRYLLALALTVFGLDKFLHFMPMPDAPVEGQGFLGALADAGYVFPGVGLVFLFTAACLLTGRIVLGLLVLAPVTLNIVLYHIRYDLPGIAAGAVIALLQVVLFYCHWRDLLPLLKGYRRD